MHQILLTDNLNEQVRIFNEVSIKSLDKCAPIGRPFAPRMNDDIRHVMQVRNNAQNKLKRDCLNIKLREEYKKLKKYVTSFINNANSTYNSKQFHDSRGNIAATWKFIQETHSGNFA